MCWIKLKWLIPLGIITALIIFLSTEKEGEYLEKEDYTIQIDGGNYFSTNKNQNYLITTDKKNAYDWELFTFYYLDSNHVKIKTFFGKYIVINQDGFLQANTTKHEFKKGAVFKLNNTKEGGYSLMFSDKDIYRSSKELLKVGDADTSSKLKIKIEKAYSLSKEKKEEKAKDYRLGKLYYQVLFISIIIFLLNYFIPVINIDRRLVYILPFLLLGYIIIRAINISFVIDEAWSYDILINESYYFRALIFDDSNHYVANNHVLNTLFGYISLFLFGNSPFGFRVFNILAFIMYAFYSIKIISYFSKSRMSLLIALVFFFLNPFMLEFFSLYRGYGLSLAFLSGLIYCFSQLYFEGYQKRQLLLGLFFSVLAVYANFALLFPVFIFQISYFIYLNKNKSIASIINHNSTYLFITGALLFLPALSNILILSSQKELFFGGEISFIKDSLDSIVSYTFYTENLLDKLVLEVILVFLFFTALFSTKNKQLYTATIVILSVVLLSTVLNLIVGSKFAIGRASLYLIPLLGIFIMLLYDNPIKHKTYKIFISIIIVFISISAIKHGLNSYNFNRTMTWRHDVNNENVLKDIVKINNNKEFTLAAFWIFNQPLKYYAEYHHVKELISLKRLEDEAIMNDCDFYYIRKYDLKNIKFEYTVLKEYEESETLIISKKEKN